MSYFGRTVGIGITKRGDIAALYAVSGRSEGSKSRLAKIVDDGFIKRVRIRPIKEPKDEQKRSKSYPKNYGTNDTKNN